MRSFRCSRTRYGKRPVIYGNSTTFETLLGNEFLRYPIWFADYAGPTAGTRLAGSNPWTLWQYTNKTARNFRPDDPVSTDSSTEFPQVNGVADANAFFGTRDDWAQFTRDGANISRMVATGQPEP